MSVKITRHIRQRCPICEGRKVVPAGFYSFRLAGTTNPDPCRQCGGTGMIAATEVVEDPTGGLIQSNPWPPTYYHV